MLEIGFEDFLKVDEMNISLTIVIGIVACTWLYVFFVSPYLSYKNCKDVGIKISLLNVFFMLMRKIKYKIICDSLVKLKINDIELNSDFLEAHFLAGGNTQLVVDAMILNKKKNIGLSFEQLTAYDLAQVSPLEVVEKSEVGKIFNPFKKN